MESLQINDTIPSITITDLTIDGYGIGRINNQVIFVEKAILGEEVEAKVTNIRKRIIFAEKTKTLKQSSFESLPKCPDFGVCGGCMWQNLEYRAACNWKKSHIQESLSRIGKFKNIKVDSFIESPSLTAMRNKMSYAFSFTEDRINLGLKKYMSHDVLPVSSCILQPSIAMEILDKVRILVSKDPENHKIFEDYLLFLAIHTPEYNNYQQIVLEFITYNKPSKHFKITRNQKILRQTKLHEIMHSLLEENKQIQGIVHSERKSSKLVAQGEKIIYKTGKTLFFEQIGNLLLESSPSAFLQTNTKAASKLYDSILSNLNLTGDEIIWDIHCGIGAIGLYLAPYVKRVYGIDSFSASISLAVKNSKRLNLSNSSFYNLSNISALASKTEEPTIIILDPPRGGLQPSDIDYLLNTKASRFVYVSCNIATQARDLNLLSRAWKIDKVIGVDMFPYTPHCEQIIFCTRL